MVHGILKQHGGWITFDSELGHGTQFQMYLPLAQDSSALPPARFTAPAACNVNTPPPVRANSSTVLLVDDEEMIRVLGRTILETNGYRVLEAQDGQEAVETFAVKGDEIDLVILDVTMPRLSGRDAFGRIQTCKPGTRVLFSSGYSSEDLSGIEGSLGMLTKPYRPKDLLGAVHRALSNLPIAVPTNEA
jgi:two-component system, cell cycle sensor histidine kinase and response regulator CckA